METKKKMQKVTFTNTKKLLKIDDIDVDKILVSKKKTYGTNKSINISLDKMTVISIKLLCIKLPQMTGYVKCFDSNNEKS